MLVVPGKLPVLQDPVAANRQMPDMGYLYQELKRKSVTLQLLWYEYKQSNADGYQYSQFCNLYRQWDKKLDITLRQEHRAGEKLFIDYAGQTVPILDPQTGKVDFEAQIFIATLGPAITVTPKSPHPRHYPTGSNPTSAPLSSSAGFRRFWCPTI